MSPEISSAKKRNPFNELEIYARGHTLHTRQPLLIFISFQEVLLSFLVLVSFAEVETGFSLISLLAYITVKIFNDPFKMPITFFIRAIRVLGV